MSTHAVTVRHNFETAHRLPHLGGKCASLHGHSWWVEVTAACQELASTATVVEFGEFKKQLREWIDLRLDHGTMLGYQDPLRDALTADGSKLFVFGEAEAGPAVADLEWPTVENVAVLLGRIAEKVIEGTESAQGARITRVVVKETHVNAAEWCP